MSNRLAFAQRAPLLNCLYASIACAVTLTLAASPAQAQSAGLERVEVSGRVIEAPMRYDVRASCASIDQQLQEALQTTWERERRVGQVKVQIVMEDGDIKGVTANGISNRVEESVRHAINGLQCGHAVTSAAVGPQIYRFSVDFADPDDRLQRIAGFTRGAYRLALLKD